VFKNDAGNQSLLCVSAVSEDPAICAAAGTVGCVCWFTVCRGAYCLRPVSFVRRCATRIQARSKLHCVL
jgi:hypothetical protein